LGHVGRRAVFPARHGAPNARLAVLGGAGRVVCQGRGGRMAAVAALRAARPLGVSWVGRAESAFRYASRSTITQRSRPPPLPCLGTNHPEKERKKEISFFLSFSGGWAARGASRGLEFLLLEARLGTPSQHSDMLLEAQSPSGLDRPLCPALAQTTQRKKERKKFLSFFLSLVGGWRRGRAGGSSFCF